MKTVIKPCTCEHEYQDKVYGKGNRVHNTKGNKTGALTCRCTVCKKEQVIK